MIALPLFALAANAMSPESCLAALEEARALYGGHDVAGARAKFAQAASRDCAADARTAAETELARVEWLVDGHTDAAVQRLKASLAMAPNPCPGVRLLARVLNASERWRETAHVGSGYFARCASLEPQLHLDIVAARVAQARLAPASRRPQYLAAARAALAAAPPLAQASLDAARLRLQLGLLAGDAKEAVAGWREFFWLDRGAPQRSLVGAAEQESAIFQRGLDRRAADGDRLALVRRLIRGGFAVEAGWLAKTNPAVSTSSDWRDVRAYLRMRDRLAVALLAHDRAWARGDHSVEEGLEPALLAILRDAVTDAGSTGHGIANARLLGDLVAWIERHPADVRGYDPAKPALMQIDRLSDEQLVAIARLLDPEK